MNTYIVLHFAVFVHDLCWFFHKTTCSCR